MRDSVGLSSSVFTPIEVNCDKYTKVIPQIDQKEGVEPEPTISKISSRGLFSIYWNTDIKPVTGMKL